MNMINYTLMGHCLSERKTETNVGENKETGSF